MKSENIFIQILIYVSFTLDQATFHILRTRHFSKKLSGSWPSAPVKKKQQRIELLHRYKQAKTQLAKTSRITVLNIRELCLYFEWSPPVCLNNDARITWKVETLQIKSWSWVILDIIKSSSIELGSCQQGCILECFRFQTQTCRFIVLEIILI